MNELDTLRHLIANPDYCLKAEDSHAPSIMALIEKNKELLGTPKYKSSTPKYLNQELLNPPAYQPSKEEIDAAMCRYVLEERVWSLVYYMQEYIKDLEDSSRKSTDWKTHAKMRLQWWDEAMEKWDDDTELWETLVDKDWFEKVYVHGLSDMHCGDCTAHAATCSRCLAEEMFKIPNTANWSKSRGYGLFNAYARDVEEKKLGSIKALS